MFNKVYTKTKLQFVLRISKINYFEVKVHTPFLNCCIIKLCSYEKNKIDFHLKYFPSENKSYDKDLKLFRSNFDLKD